MDFTKRLEAFCRSFPGVTERLQWNDKLVFKVGAKMFCTISMDENSFGDFRVKCSQEVFYELIERAGIRPAPYLARANWILIEPKESRMPVLEAEALIDKSYKIVFDRLQANEKLKISLNFQELNDTTNRYSGRVLAPASMKEPKNKPPRRRSNR